MAMESLERLERKARRLIEVLREVREENRRLRKRLEEGKGPPAPRNTDTDRQLRLLLEERNAIRDRVERAIRSLESEAS